MTPQTELQGVIELAKREILEDVANGIVPATVRDYSQLHDYVDANKYGGAFEDTAHSCADSDFWNAMQDAVNVWIKNGGLQAHANIAPAQDSVERFIEVRDKVESFIQRTNDLLRKK